MYRALLTLAVPALALADSHGDTLMVYEGKYTTADCSGTPIDGIKVDASRYISTVLPMYFGAGPDCFTMEGGPNPHYLNFTGGCGADIYTVFGCPGEPMASMENVWADDSTCSPSEDKAGEYGFIWCGPMADFPYSDAGLTDLSAMSDEQMIAMLGQDDPPSDTEWPSCVEDCGQNDSPDTCADLEGLFESGKCLSDCVGEAKLMLLEAFMTEDDELAMCSTFDDIRGEAPEDVEYPSCTEACPSAPATCADLDTMLDGCASGCMDDLPALKAAFVADGTPFGDCDVFEGVPDPTDDDSAAAALLSVGLAALLMA